MTENTATEARPRGRRNAADEVAADAVNPSTPNGETAQSETKPERAPRAKAPDTSAVSLDAINGASLAVPDLVAAAAPVRERTDQQKTMDAVAAKAYAEWVKADKPSAWAKMPVVTYFLDEDELSAYRYLIRRACEIVEPVDGATGVRVRFGNEFTLSEAMAAKINRPELAGKTVLAWSAVDRRAATEKTDK
jgi:hypothetical protein